MRPFISVVLWLVFLAILDGIGVSIYNAGVSAGLAQAGAVAGGAVAPYVYGWGFHPGFLGFGFLGLIFPILFLFLVFGLIRAAMFGGRRGWGHDWQPDRERYLADLHRRMHEAEGTDVGRGPHPSGSSGTDASGGGAPR
ncbi:MAG TPA: hypothetical protein VF494_03355 [Candidatus Limnocylindrales bacterium]